MLLFYGIIYTAFFCFFLKAFWNELLKLHEVLLQRSFLQYASIHAKGQSCSNRKVGLFPKTWRSTWLGLTSKTDDLVLLKELALKSGLLDFCKSSITNNPKSMAENFQILALFDCDHEAMNLLQKIPIGSGLWLEGLHKESLRTHEISLYVLRRLIATKRFEGTKRILDEQALEGCPSLLADLVATSHEATALAFSYAAEKSLSLQMKFIREIIKTESFEIFLLKYRSRFLPEAKALIDESLESSHWWLAHVIKPSGVSKNRPVLSLDWYFETQRAPEEAITPPETIETILIAG